jgi:predicted nucleic-acid-binding protein
MSRDQLSQSEIANDVEMVLAADRLEVQNEQEVYHAVVALRNGTGSFEDALIGSFGIWRGCSVTSPSTKKLRSDCVVSHWPDCLSLQNIGDIPV